MRSTLPCPHMAAPAGGRESGQPTQDERDRAGFRGRQNVCGDRRLRSKIRLEMRVKIPRGHNDRQGVRTLEEQRLAGREWLQWFLIRTQGGQVDGGNGRSIDFDPFYRAGDSSGILTQKLPRTPPPATPSWCRRSTRTASISAVCATLPEAERSAASGTRPIPLPLHERAAAFT